MVFLELIRDLIISCVVCDYWKTYGALTKRLENRYNKGKLEMRFSNFFVSTKTGINTGIEVYKCHKKELVFTETAGNNGKNRGGFPICHFSPVLEQISKDTVATG